MAAQANPFDVSVIVSRQACMICVWKRCCSSTDWFSRSGTAHRYSPECGLLDTVRPLCYLSSYQDTVWEVNCRHYMTLYQVMKFQRATAESASSLHDTGQYGRSLTDTLTLRRST